MMHLARVNIHIGRCTLKLSINKERQINNVSDVITCNNIDLFA